MIKAKYAKFIILGRGRTGSTLLVYLLKSHPGIRCYGELFDVPFLVKKKIALKGAAEYYSEIYRKYPSHIKAVGFKLLYAHADPEILFSKKNLHSEFVHGMVHERFKRRMYILKKYLKILRSEKDLETVDQNILSVWKTIEDDQDLKVVHIKRKNKLKLLVSLIKGLMLDEFFDKNNKSSKYNDTYFELPFSECEDFFKKAEEDEIKFNKIFENHPVMDIFYEDLSEDIDGIMGKVQKFLGVSQKKLKTRMKKQNKQNISETITNYWKLKERFKNTRWAEFFDE